MADELPFSRFSKDLGIGAWPELTLIEARAKRDEARREIARGTDPGEKLKLDRIASEIAAAITFRSVADEWLTKTEKEGLSTVTLKKNRWLLAFAFEKLGTRPIPEITPHELLGVLRKVEGRGRHDSAKRIRAICSQVFRYGIATARADRDVAADLRGALIVPKVTHRAAITTPNEAGALLRAIESFEGHPTTDIALKLAPHVFVRPGELRSGLMKLRIMIMSSWIAFKYWGGLMGVGSSQPALWTAMATRISCWDAGISRAKARREKRSAMREHCIQSGRSVTLKGDCASAFFEPEKEGRSRKSRIFGRLDKSSVLHTVPSDCLHIVF